MKVSGTHTTAPEAAFKMRAARFEDVSEILRLVRRAVDQGCRDHYSPQQRDAVHVGYARCLFEEVSGPFETLVADQQGRILAMAQLDPSDGRLRALFVDARSQNRGFGRAMVSAIEECAMRRRLPSLHGAMALNAVSFYLRAGFRPCGGPERLMSAGILVPIQRMAKDLRTRTCPPSTDATHPEGTKGPSR